MSKFVSNIRHSIYLFLFFILSVFVRTLGMEVKTDHVHFMVIESIR